METLEVQEAKALFPLSLVKMRGFFFFFFFKARALQQLGGTDIFTSISIRPDTLIKVSVSVLTAVHCLIVLMSNLFSFNSLYIY